MLGSKARAQGGSVGSEVNWISTAVRKTGFLFIAPTHQKTQATALCGCTPTTVVELLVDERATLTSIWGGLAGELPGEEWVLVVLVLQYAVAHASESL